MLSKLIASLFPEGQRKVMVSLIAILIGAGAEKFGGGLSEHLSQLLIAVVAVFTGGNVLKGFSDAIATLKGTSIGQKIEDLLPGDQGLGATVQAAQAVQPHGHTEMEAFFQFMDEAKGRIDKMSEQITTQAKNTEMIVNIVNQMRGIGAPPKPAPQPQAPR